MARRNGTRPTGWTGKPSGQSLIGLNWASGEVGEWASHTRLGRKQRVGGKLLERCWSVEWSGWSGWSVGWAWRAIGWMACSPGKGTTNSASAVARQGTHPQKFPIVHRMVLSEKGGGRGEKHPWTSGVRLFCCYFEPLQRHYDEHPELACPGNNFLSVHGVTGSRGHEGRAGEGRKEGHGLAPREWTAAVWTSPPLALDSIGELEPNPVLCSREGQRARGLGACRSTCSLGAIEPATLHGRIRARHQS
ncbi:hypothetical protein I7I51_02859 [Histoplasma capsulatum]|uniref:Uncharacterized protein n=1 Tax=Ajellomyces capsulatus TaxID=5037 RepID=A0A8A1MLG2_AJECA|nr:hypothetical protein I7I51_02859 [Histoplasma capsulatum]